MRSAGMDFTGSRIGTRARGAAAAYACRIKSRCVRLVRVGTSNSQAEACSRHSKICDFNNLYVRENDARDARVESPKCPFWRPSGGWCGFSDFPPGPRRITQKFKRSPYNAALRLSGDFYIDTIPPAMRSMGAKWFGPPIHPPHSPLRRGRVLGRWVVFMSLGIYEGP